MLGDVYHGYFVPTVICGRSLSVKRDVTAFVANWCDRTLEGDINKLHREHADLGLEALGVEFKDRMFSKILVVSPKENVTDAWQILWGVWSEVFRLGPERESKDYALYFRVSCVFLMFYLYHSQTGSHNLPIPLSLETFHSCLALAHEVLSRLKVTSVFNVLNHMLNHKCFSFASYDGLQYLHQSKFGRPLKVDK